MNATTTTTAKIFLTDYASYNNGTQFEFGHWVELSDFNDADELQDYISAHFKECDKKSPLDEYGSIREETMITDFEGFPKEYYSESGCNWDKIFKYMQIDWENKSDDEKISLHNEYCQAQCNEDEIYIFDDEFFEIFFDGKPMEICRATAYGNVNFTDNYIKFNGYGNLESMNDYEAVNSIDKQAVIDWMIENL